MDYQDWYNRGIYLHDLGRVSASQTLLTEELQ
jgi:hypothetical protein